MLPSSVVRRTTPDFVQRGPFSHTFGQPFDSATMRPLQRIRSLWPFPVASDEVLESSFGADHEEAQPSSFVT